VLRRNGEVLPLEPKVFDTLLVLVENHGKVVSKEGLMKAVWGPDTFVEEGSIARNISLLRKTLAEGLGDAQCIATFPKRGYEFVGPVRDVTGTNRPEAGVEGSGQDGVETDGGHPQGAPLQTLANGHPQQRTVNGHPQAVPLQALAGCVAVLALALGYWFVRPLPAPVVLDHQALTHDGREKKGPLLTDGSRLYFEERVDGEWMLAAVPTVGGEVRFSALPSPGVVISDIAPGGTELIGWEEIPGTAAGRLLVWPVADGPAEYPAGLRGVWPAWSPDGTRIAFSDGVHSLFVAGRHGEGLRKVASVVGSPQGVRWSPDGESLCFSQLDPKSEASSVWEAPATGGDPHPLRIGGKNLDSVPVWTPDGTYSLFLWGSKDAVDIWAQRENCNPVRWRCREPMRIAAGLGGYMDQLPSRDGKRLFVIEGQEKKELARYDMKSKAFVPYLPTVLAGDVDFSPDGNWVAYARLPDRTLWRSWLDGSNATPLTVSGAEAYSPHWSPDGKQIAYMAIYAQKHYKACAVDANGGPPQQLLPGAGEEGVPTWSRDGNSVVFGDTLHVGHASAMAIHLLDLRNHQLSTLPGSKGLWNPRWSPDGRYIAALVLSDDPRGNLTDSSALLLYDFRTSRWTTLTKAENFRNLTWSRDSQYVYFHTGWPEPGMYRVHIVSGQVEPLASQKDLEGVFDDWIGVAPDGSPLIMKDTCIDEIYALDVQWP
jgi:Tol biopolymer transport system component/DNA-binding winged helix-turn-helix (wHTH) protein